MLHCDAWTDDFVKPLWFIIAYVDPDVAGKSMGENNTQSVSCHWPGDDDSIVQIVTSMVDMTIWSIMNAAIASLPYLGRKIRQLWDCLEERNGDGG